MSTIPQTAPNGPARPSVAAGVSAGSDVAGRSRAVVWVAAGVLLVATLVAYWRVGSCGFVNIDDDAYVEHQPMLNRGLHAAAVVWSFTASHSGTWHPFASLSHALDCQLFGVRAGPMHWENLGWHIANALLVFWIWRGLFGGVYRAALVAGLFALHPLNVESVAWISERKNVLSTFFWLLGMAAYLRYARAPSVRSYIAVCALFLCGLLAKPMLVTFPCVLLLLDWWPLARWPRITAWSLLKEKIPLFVLSAAVSAATIVAQAYTGATDYGHRFSLADRLGNAVVSYARYLGKTVWPESLSVFYFHPGSWPAVNVLAALALLVAITVFVWTQRKARRWLAFGWLWFVGTLVPVIGIVQSGAQAMADRYAYVPLLGIFTIVAYAGEELVGRFPRWRTVALAGAIVTLIACGVLTRRQVANWTDSSTLYRHSIAVGEDNPAVRFLYAASLIAAGRPEEEITAQYRRALEQQPDYINALTQLAVYALAHDRVDESRALIEKSIQCEPNNPQLRYNLGSFFVRIGRIDDAIRTYHEVLRMNPRTAGAHFELGQIYLNQKRFEDGLREYAERARLDRWNPDAQCDYGILLANLGRYAEAATALQRTLWILPDHARARQGLEQLRKLAPTVVR